MPSPGWSWLAAAALIGGAAGFVLRDVTASRAEEGAASPVDAEALHARIETLEARLKQSMERAVAPTATLAGSPSPTRAAPPAASAAPTAGAPRSKGSRSPDAPSSSAKSTDVPLPTGSAASAWKNAAAWELEFRALTGPEPRRRAVAAMETALSGRSEGDALAGLLAVAHLGLGELAADEWRPRVMPWAGAAGSSVRLAAKQALNALGPRPEDVELWIAELRASESKWPEEAVFGLVAAAQGVVEGRVADAVLEVVAEGRDVARAFVMRGLQEFKTMDARLVARLVEIARSVDPQNYDSYYFFYFLAPKFDPKPDAVIDLAIETAKKPYANLKTIGLAFHRGLDDRQRMRVVAGLLDAVDGGLMPAARVAALGVLAPLATRLDVPRLEALAANPQADDATRKAAEVAAKQAATR